MLLFQKGSSYSKQKHLYELELTLRLKQNKKVKQSCVQAYHTGNDSRSAAEQRSAYFFSSATQLQQEVHVSERGSAETALDKSEKKQVKKAQTSGALF